MLLSKRQGSLGKPATPAAWNVPRPKLRAPRLGLHWIGPIAVFATALLSWPAFSGSTGEEGSVAFGLWIGSVSIVLMAWSFLLAVRFKWPEPFFGGLDRMYRVHRWAGSVAIVAMWLHTRAEPEIEGGIRGASRALAESAQSAAGLAEYFLYLLILMSLVRLVPYRFWRWTHKLLGIPFVIACWHFFTAEKPYANGSGWGWWFGGFMVAGTAAYLLRVVGRDVAAPGIGYRIAAAEHTATTTALALEPVGRRVLHHRAGQWVVLKVQLPGLREPHPFSVASAPGEQRLRFVIRDLGDWTRRLRDADLVGAQVAVEGPYGRFNPRGRRDRPSVWIAGGVGITPFLSALGQAGPAPHLFYAVRSREDAAGLGELEQAEQDGRLHLHLFPSKDGRRLTPQALEDVFGVGGLRGHHVALCGPKGLLGTMVGAARSLGARRIVHEEFDIRQGIGPEISLDVDNALAAARELRSGS